MIIAHIVGLPNDYKDKLINDLKEFKDISIIDLDKITQQIISERNMITLYNKIDDIMSSNKGKYALKTKREIEKKINEYWKTKIDINLLKEINKGNRIICIGMSTFFKNHRIGIKIVCPIKLFIKLNLEDNAKKIIADNLTNRRDEIIEGTFDLNYLNLDYLIKKREELQTIYDKMGYQLKSYNDIYKTTQLGLYNITPDGLYFADHKNYTKTELGKKKNIVGYTDEWLAIVGLLNEYDNIIEKGIKNKTPYIKLNKNKEKEISNEPIYIYYTSETTFFMPELTNSKEIYKYISTKSIKKFTHTQINDPIKRLKDLNIKII